MSASTNRDTTAPTRRDEKSRTGVMFFTDGLAAADLIEFARRVEAKGLDTLWLPEVFGREVFASAGFLLAATSTLTVASGIANVYARDGLSAAQAAHTLAELSGGRFVLGLGVSNPGIVEGRGGRWEAPVPKLTKYFDAMAAAKVLAPRPASPAPVFLAAHGPRLLDIARERTDGANTYLMPPEHTAMARVRLGPQARLNAVQHCMLWSGEDAEQARGLARRAVQRYVELDYYQRIWGQYGFEADDFEHGGSDRLIDTLVAWGDAEAIAARLALHRDAGADEVVIVPLNPDGGGRAPHWPLLDELSNEPSEV